MFGSSSHGSSNQPAEVFRKDLISAMKLPDSYQLQPDEYMIMTDNWKPEWEKGVQVPVNPQSIPMADIKEIRKPDDIDFKLTKKYIKGYDTEDEKEDDADGPEKKDAMCQYDLDEADVHWLSQINLTREEMGDEAVDELTMERIIEECDIQCNNNMEHAMQTEEGLGIEYDEDVICDVCRAPDSEEGNEMVFCDKCDICVHQACYGIVNVPEGSWMCRTCALGIQPLCILCGIKGGAMKSTRSGTKWSHVSCALWVPEVSIGCVERMEPITKISQIPASRWALICVQCRERTGACIQCSVKTCKIAYHVTCGFENGLEMKTYLDEEADVRFRSYCSKHTKIRREEGILESKLGTPDKTHGTPKKDIKEMTQEERANERAIRIQLVTEEFYRYTKLKDIVSSLDMKNDVETVDVVYEYWKLKRKSGHNRPLVAPTKEVGSLGSNEEYNLTARMKMFVHLRQDLERVRNLCYMVQRREKLSRQLSVLSQSVFRKQCDMHAAGLESFSEEDLEWAIKVGKFAIHLPVSDSEATLTDTATSKDCDTDERLSKDCDTDDRSEEGENGGDASERTAETQNGADTDAISSAGEDSETRQDSDKECNDKESEDEKMEVTEAKDVVKAEEEEEEEVEAREDEEVEREVEFAKLEEKVEEEEEEETEEEKEEEEEEEEEEEKEVEEKKEEEESITDVEEDREVLKESLKNEVEEEKEVKKEKEEEAEEEEEEEENWKNKRRLRTRSGDRKEDNVKKKEERDLVKEVSVTVKEEKEDSGKELINEKIKEKIDEDEERVEEEEEEEDETEEEEEEAKEESNLKEEEEPDDDDLLLQINEKIKEYDEEEEEDAVAHLNHHQVEERTKEVMRKHNDYISNLRLVSPHRSRESSLSNDRCSSPRSADADESDIADDSDRENSFIRSSSLSPPSPSPPCLKSRREEVREDVQSETSCSVSKEDETEGPYVKSVEDSVTSNDTEHRHSAEAEPPNRPSLKRKISLKAIREAEMRKNGMSKKRKRDSHHRKTKNRKRRSSDETSDQPVYSIVRTPTRDSPSKISIKIHSPQKVSPKKLQLDEEATKLRQRILNSASPRSSLKSYRIPKKKPIISHTLSNGPAKKEPPEIDPFEFVDEQEEPVHKPETRSRRKLIDDELDSESSYSDRQFEPVDQEVSMCLQGRESPYKGGEEENATLARETANANLAREERLKKRNLSSRIRDAAVRFLNSAINL